MTRFEEKNEFCSAKSNFIAEVNQSLCKGCGLCMDRCVFEAIIIEDKDAFVQSGKCYGCGVCAATCPTQAMKLHRYERSAMHENGMKLMHKIYVENRKTNDIRNN